MKNTGPDQRTKDAVILRDGFTCRRCGSCPGGQIHHRAPRGRGGTRAPWINGMANLVLLCQPCHEHVETHRTEGYATGWLVKRTSIDIPEEVPLTDLVGRQFFFTDAGRVITLRARESA